MVHKPRIALLLGIICISIFPVIIRLQLSSGLISAFYRMAIAAAILFPYVVFTNKMKFSSPRMIFPSVLCGIIFASDIAVWNISIQESTATQATLLTNLSPVWVGIISFLFLKNKPRPSFWTGVSVAMAGIVVFIGLHTFRELSFDRAFFLGMLSGFFYSLYILLSKKVLETTEVMPFIAVSFISSTIFLLFVNIYAGEAFTGFGRSGWIALIVQGVVCQLLAWVLISYATKHMRATRISLSLLGQVIFAGLFAWIFINEQISLQKIAGGSLILAGIMLTFYEPRKA